MDFEIFKLIKNQLGEDLIDLSNHFNIDPNDAITLLDKEYMVLKREKRYFKGDTKKRCNARIWNNGYGAQCSRHQTNGSNFLYDSCRIKTS